jgi:hypothetical protein
MSYVITTSEVLDGFTTSASTADLTAYIAVVDLADTCLTANSVSVPIGKQLKILGVRHLASNAEGGSVLEERAISGASRKFGERSGGQTSYLDTLRSIDAYGCVMSSISSPTGDIQLRSIGRRSPT